MLGLKAAFIQFERYLDYKVLNVVAHAPSPRRRRRGRVEELSRSSHSRCSTSSGAFRGSGISSIGFESFQRTIMNNTKLVAVNSLVSVHPSIDIIYR